MLALPYFPIERVILELSLCAYKVSITHSPIGIVIGFDFVTAVPAVTVRPISSLFT